MLWNHEKKLLSAESVCSQKMCSVGKQKQDVDKGKQHRNASEMV